LKVETADYLAKARECLMAAQKIMAIPLPEVAATEGYLAAYHAAHALVFERSGRVVKSHSGMRTMLARILRDGPGIDRTFASLLARAYKFKEVADYGVGSQAVVTAQEAQEVIDIARRFIDTIAESLSPGSQPKS
jgi:uncharacterized protein (UPF0332 family)